VLAAAFVEPAQAGIPVYVMMPLDTMNNDGSLNNPDGVKNNLQTLKNTGATGIMVDCWWGIVETSPKSYNFSGYSDLFDIANSVGMKVQAVMSFHKCGGNVGDTCNIPIPNWVTNIAKQGNSDIFYKDQDGNYDDEYLSLFTDTQSLYEGRTGVQLYSDFMSAFAEQFKSELGSLIVEIQVGMGPAGELRYPSYQMAHWQFCGIGAFQCYDSYALQDLASSATAAGHSDWGSAGPNNAGDYNSHPTDTGFFGEDTSQNNYESDYGKFFLNWYSQALISHADRVLKVASNAFSGTGVGLAGKIAGIHWWALAQSRAAEATAGYYVTNGNDGYEQIASVFAKYGANIDFTCLEMLDSEQPSSCACGPQEVVQDVRVAAKAGGTGFSGENALARYDTTAYNTIETEAGQSSSTGGQPMAPLDAFTYLRLSDTLLQSDNLNNFHNFINAMNGI